MFFNRISLRIALLYSVAFFLSALALFVLTSYLLMSSLKTKDRDLLMEKSREYSALYQRDGTAGLQLRVTSREIKSAQDFVVRLANSEGKTLFLYSPDRTDDEDAPQLADIESYLSGTPGDETWITIRGGDFGDDVEVFSVRLSSGEVLQVGKDTEDREAFFQSFAQAYVQGLIPIFLVAIAVGSILSHRLLKPIRTLTETVESIRSGNSKARVPLKRGHDELQRLSELLNQMLEQNERLVDGMRETLDQVAHDLRTPIMRLQNSVEKALSGPDELELLKTALGESHENSDAILKLVDGIMDINEAAAGTLKLRREPLSAKDLLSGVLDLYSFVAEDKQITLLLDSSSDFTFDGDKMRMLQVVSNLVDNAIKYSPASTTINLSARIEKNEGVITVIDQGIGVPHNDQTRIWERLYRADQSRSSRGLGLGLSIVKAIVQAHGGNVGVRSNANGIGTMFFIRVPVSPSILTKM